MNSSRKNISVSSKVSGGSSIMTQSPFSKSLGSMRFQVSRARFCSNDLRAQHDDVVRPGTTAQHVNVCKTITIRVRDVTYSLESFDRPITIPGVLLHSERVTCIT
ncbi:hypothetical protein M758_UG123800 [Ceratodon purpureus]|nr:hypothetical protein M758_UG123800 [Ceratodon purpureus]